LPEWQLLEQHLVFSVADDALPAEALRRKICD
jgi:hypothetical protein